MTASWARDVAQGLLPEALPRRWAHVQGVAGKAERAAASLALSGDVLVAAALAAVERTERCLAGERPG